MPHIYRITKSPEVGDLVASVDALEAFAREHGPSSYDVDEHSLDPFPDEGRSPFMGQGDTLPGRVHSHGPDTVAILTVEGSPG
jgi:hypothetical protein